MSFSIAQRKIGLKEEPFIIAEISANHQQSLETVFRIIDEMADAKVDAIKVQTLRPDKITLNCRSKDFMVEDKNNLWHGQSLFELYQKAYLPWEWHKEIFDYAKDKSLLAFSTPFDLEAVDFLETLDVPLYKIGSCENRDIPLIKKVASTNKPVIISTGMATLAELAESVDAARQAGCKDLALLKCTCSYPADPKESNLMTIPHMRDLFKCEVGISDHSLGIGAAIASISLGASIIEKHVNLDGNNEALDAAFSLTPSQMKQLKLETTRAFESLGEIHYGPSKSELNSLRYRRSLYASKDIYEDEVFTLSNTQSVRPGYGLAPKYHDLILGKKAKKKYYAGEPLDWDGVI